VTSSSISGSTAGRLSALCAPFFRRTVVGVMSVGGLSLFGMSPAPTELGMTFSNMLNASVMGEGGGG